MAEEFSPSSLPRHLAIAAFEGWNDAGNAATNTIDLLAGALEKEHVFTMDPEPYHDFQVARPRTTRLADGGRELTWPLTTVARHRDEEGNPLVLIRGVEPSMRWRSYCQELFDQLEELGVATVICLGALLADVPHTRPLPVSATSSSPLIQDALGLEASTYEGPSGIVSVLDHLGLQAGFQTASAWVTVPHYVAQPPSPKATLALLGQVQDLTGLPLPQGDLVDESRAWQAGVDALAATDDEIGEYVKSLEEASDAAESPEATGDALAKEFERYLRRRDGWHDKGPQ